MRVNIHAHGLELTPHLRAFVQSRLIPALGPYRERVQLVNVRIEAHDGRDQSQTTACEIAVTLRPSGEVRVRAEDRDLPVAISRASSGIGAAVEREALQPRPTLASPSASRHSARSSRRGADADDRRVSDRRKMPHRRDNDGGPTRGREYWRPPLTEGDVWSGRLPES